MALPAPQAVSSLQTMPPSSCPAQGDCTAVGLGEAQGGVVGSGGLFQLQGLPRAGEPEENC